LKLLTLARDLRRRTARERRGLFVAEGIRTVDELLRSPLELSGVLVTPQLSDTPRGQTLLSAIRDRKVPLLEVSTAEFASAAETDTPQGVLGIAEVPKRTLAQIPNADVLRLLGLDAVQDPGNVGTSVRTAAALGAVATGSFGFTR